MKKPHNHDGNEMKCKVEEFRTNLKQPIEDSSQPVKRIYREQLISLYTTSPQSTPFTPMFYEIKDSLYKTRNTSYLPAPCKIDDVNIEGIWTNTLNSEQFILHNSIHPIFRTLSLLNNYQKAIMIIYFLMEGLNQPKSILSIIFSSFNKQ